MEAVTNVTLMKFDDFSLQNGWNILMYAAYQGKEDVVKYLCNQCRIDPFVKDNEVR